MFSDAVALFKIPSIAVPYIKLFLTEDEISLLCTMEDRIYKFQELSSLVACISKSDPGNFIKESYSRGVLNKAPGDELLYRPASFYTRLAFFAQYEPELWQSIPEEARKSIDEWCVNEYIESARPRLEKALASKEGLIENAYFYTLEETVELIKSLDFAPYVVPCNCKSVAMACDKPRNVCMLFGRGINSEWDRGHGKELTKQEAIDLTVLADKSGLMHTSEDASAVCSCCGDCCYPIRASKTLGTQGIWPKQRYKILWDKESCINCGKCARICNFNAFKREEGMIVFDEKACWGCTICKNHCPVKAISIQKL